MRIYAFVGPSGTGKSYRAQWVARENNLECIIDDGLLIKENKILAGKSAKKEASKIASVKCAIFTNDEHSSEMISVIKKENPNGILILGTSMEMINKIVERLKLPQVEKVIKIEDVANEKEIERAKYLRKQLGKHVIPVPIVEIKSQFSGYFLNPLKIFRRKENVETASSEKTIVRPAFSYMGEYTISENVINALIYNVGKDFSGIKKILKVRNKNFNDGIIIEIELMAQFGFNLIDIMSRFAEKVKLEIDRMTALNIERLDIEIKDIYIEVGQ